VFSATWNLENTWITHQLVGKSRPLRRMDLFLLPQPSGAQRLPVRSTGRAAFIRAEDQNLGTTEEP